MLSHDRLNDALFYKMRSSSDEIPVEDVFDKEIFFMKHDLVRLIIEYLPDQIYLKDTSGRFLLCNMPVAKNAGCERPDDMIGKTDFDFYPADEAEAFLADEKDIMRSGNALINHEEHYTDTSSGEMRWNLTTKVPVVDEYKKVIGLLGINRDITIIKNALLEQERTMTDLKRRNDELEQFTHIVSHSLRVPVANILGLASLVTNMYAVGADDRKVIVDGITSSIQNLDEIVHDLNSVLERRQKSKKNK